MTPSSGASASRKRKSELGEGSSNKKAKTQPLPLKRLPAMLQTALYAAERVSDAICISHAINLVVIGESPHSYVSLARSHLISCR